MITTCTICQARYQLDGTKVPRKIIRVRCPSCSGVFVLDGTAPPLVTDFQKETPAVETPVQEAPAQAFETQPAFSSEPEINTPEVIDESFEVEGNDAWEIPETPEVPSFEEPSQDSIDQVVEAVPPVESPAAATVDSVPSKKRRRRSNEEMLARALVSDILVYNRDLRDTAIKDGKLLEVLGGEIKKSWELYKEKVTPEVANSTNHFREALNEILAEGEKVF